MVFPRYSQSSNRRTTLGVLLCAAALVASGCSASDEPAAQTTADTAAAATSTSSNTATKATTGEQTATIGLTYIPNVQFSPVYVADERNYLPAGVDYRHHGQNEGLFTALLAGQEQFVVAGADEAAAADSDELQVIAPYYEQFPVVVIVPGDSPIHTMADLKGKKVGIAGFYGETWYGLVAGLKQVGLTPDDIDIQEIGYTQQAALSTGKVDAVVGFSNNDSVRFALAGFATRDLTPEVQSLRAASLITTKKFAAEHPELTAKTVAALFHAYEDLIADPNLGVAAAEKLIPELNEPEQKEAAAQTMDATAPLLPSKTVGCSGLTATQGEALVAELNTIGVDTPKVVPQELLTDAYCGDV
ncbi:ABC transporter substrate-binding protein [Corynebacterium choanae]|uniref:Thiamine biosynthesis protein n=1 Tax=Corynebacterium choanae TaxID=1862358 RepID=A0A3G6J8M8_9CORY|nr:ABC transporter substrate-binding protein [Corynebacterium choanae]AZA14417.1 Putative thiamine biosynthesis protein [Corynebacterium choanae]